MFFSGVNCGDLTGKKYSQNLDGALSVNQEFFYIDKEINGLVESGYKYEGKFSHKEISSFIPENVTIDKINDILITDSGAVVDAYDFNGLNEHEFKCFSDAIVKSYEIGFPDYKFTLVPGLFPLDVTGSLIMNDKMQRESKVVMSSHILCIENYEKFLVKPKINIKK